MASYEVSIFPYVLLIVGALAGLVGAVVSARRSSLLQLRLQSIAPRTELVNARLGRLLRRRHIRIEEYFQAFPLAEIRRQVAVCRKCTSKSRCDRAFASRQTAYPFCPNRAAIERFASRSANVLDDSGA